MRMNACQVSTKSDQLQQGFERGRKRDNLPIWSRYINGHMTLVGKLRHHHLSANIPPDVFGAPAESFNPRAVVEKHEISIHAVAVLDVRVNLSHRNPSRSKCSAQQDELGWWAWLLTCFGLGDLMRRRILGAANERRRIGQPLWRRRAGLTKGPWPMRSADLTTFGFRDSFVRS